MELRVCLQTCITFTLIAFFNPVLTYSQNEAEFIRHSFSPARLSPSYARFDDVSSLACASLCGLNENCMAINYHRSTSKCELISSMDYTGDYQSNPSGWRVYDKVVVAPPTALAQYTLYTTCSTDEDCPDPNSRCVDSLYSGTLCYCKPLFQYNQDRQRCEQVCTSLGSTFTAHADVYIYDYNIPGSVTVKPLADCEQQCIDYGDVCLSFNYRTSDSKCRLNTISLQDAIDNGLLYEENGEMVHSKDCGDE